MSEPKKRGSGWAIWLAIGVTLIVAYGGAYTMLAKARVLDNTFGGQHRVLCWVDYGRSDGLYVRIFFWPANWIDRNLFPTRWPGVFLDIRQ